MRSMLMLATVVLSVLAVQQTARACSVCRCGDQSFFINNARQLTGGRFLMTVEHFNTRKSAAVLHGHDDGGHGLAKLSGSGSGQHEEVGREAQTQLAACFSNNRHLSFAPCKTQGTHGWVAWFFSAISPDCCILFSPIGNMP